MSNVIPFQARETLPMQEVFMEVSVLIDTVSAIEEGDLIAWQFVNTKIGKSRVVLFGHWWPPEGRDHKGRFCKRGSSVECASIDGLRYSADDLQRGGLRFSAKCKCIWVTSSACSMLVSNARAVA